MPWAKSFNEEQAIEQAMRVFWQKGYESASMADLIAQTGITRGSLYNAFGDKRSLFLKALLRYEQDRQVVLAELEALDQPRTAIHTFFDTTVARTAADEDHKGCFLFNTSLELSAHDEQVRDIVCRGVNLVEAFFRRCIEVGQARGEIPLTHDPATKAKTLLACIVAIRVLGRGVYDQAAIAALADEAKLSIA